MIPKDQLELVIQKKKIKELDGWFKDHFVDSSRADYINKSPILNIEGPTGCGKTACLETLASEYKIQIREYSETSDITAIETDLSGTFDKDETANISHTIDRRRANKFEHFVINSVRFNPLYPTVPNQPQLATADSEFEDDDDYFYTAMAKPSLPPPNRGVIIHIQTPLTFARSHRIFLQSVSKLIKTIKDISRVSSRRAAIVFEDSGHKDEWSNTLPVKFKNSLGIKTIKFNAITKPNMRKFIDSIIKRNQDLVIDRDSVDRIVDDCDGDMSACISTIELLRDRSKNINMISTGVNVNESQPALHQNGNKRQRLSHVMTRIHANQILMRDMTRSVGFFHILGKIFYQKRLYPERPRTRRPTNSLERPFETENSSDSLVQRLDVNPRDLTAWLHQHYPKFCLQDDIQKAATMMENLSDVDTISINALQSSQFYEMHNHLDQLQLHLNIEASNFSLYKDQSLVTKPSHKKTTTSNGTYILKSSVETSLTTDGDLYSFSRPVSLMLHKITQAKQTLLDHLTSEIVQHDSTCRDPTKVLVDYVPYLSYVLTHPTARKDLFITIANKHPAALMMDKPGIITTVRALEVNLCQQPKSTADYESEHERLLELIDQLDSGVEDEFVAKGTVDEN